MNDLGLSTLRLLRENAWVHLRVLLRIKDKNIELKDKTRQIRSLLSDLEIVIKHKENESSIVIWPKASQNHQKNK